MELSYILKLRNALKPELRHMPLFQNGSAIIVENKEKEARNFYLISTQPLRI